MLRIQAELSCAVLIDVQEKLNPHIHDSDNLLQAQSILLQGLQHLGVPLWVTEQYVKGLGPTVSELKKYLPAECKFYEKMSFSCLGSEDFSRDLAQSGRNTVILFGIESHVCVLQSALDLLEAGYRVVVVEDCVGSRKATDRASALARLRSAGALPSSYESLLLELCVSSASTKFKGISKLIK